MMLVKEEQILLYLSVNCIRLILSIVEKFDRCNNVRYNDTPCFFMWGSQVENSSSMKPVAQWQRACLDEKMTGVQFFPSFQLFNLKSDSRRKRCVTVPHISVSMLLEYHCYYIQFLVATVEIKLRRIDYHNTKEWK